ncbi:MAG TPA: 16S rRNA (cytosine(967)-C(5))-methyltransferase RsmB [Pyrinomonadaceae bacterium]|nr:16S rRNA (cytosine(967)-C(5))-methyltransferase RsmB [Pyrinomonadaceae bacterium]
MKISPARLAAFRILKKIELEHGLSAVLLPEAEASLSGPDKGLCHALVLGVLRHQIFLDRLINTVAVGKKIDTDIRLILRIGLFQLKFLERVPPHAVLFESVELARFAKKHSAAGFVNAILRKTLRDDPQISFSSDLDRLSVETSHPIPLLERWAAHYGMERAAIIAHANNELPKTAFRKTPRTGNALNELLESGDIVPSAVVANGFVSAQGNTKLTELEDSGQIYFQDESSQLVAEIAASFVKRTFLDVCASPGSKTTAIAMSAPQAMGVAGDLSPKRTETLAKLLRKQGTENVAVVRYDAERPLPFESVFDTILLDAPCSGTGTIRHNPEIRYRVKASELERFRDRQLAMLRNAADCLGENGHLVYSTCSLERTENEEVVEAFIANEKGFEVVRVEGFERFAGENETLRTFPDRDGVDGFFAAVLRRKT